MMKTNRSSCFLAFIHENSVIQMYRLLPNHFYGILWYSFFLDFKDNKSFPHAKSERDG